MNLAGLLHLLLVSPGFWLVTIREKSLFDLGRLLALSVLFFSLLSSLLAMPRMYQRLPEVLAGVFSEVTLRDGLLHFSEETPQNPSPRQNMLLLTTLMDKRSFYYVYNRETVEDLFSPSPLRFASHGVDSLGTGLQVTRHGLVLPGDSTKALSWVQIFPEGKFSFSEDALRSRVFHHVMPALVVFFLLFTANTLFLMGTTLFNSLFLGGFILILGRYLPEGGLGKLLLLSLLFPPLLHPLFTLADAGWQYFGNITMMIMVLEVSRVLFYSRRLYEKENDE
ncbi:hypothetical protein [Chitinivibrio alkaliphilus]|uniref:DUF1189 domain-containing protein n=1 Tax=Chitinivibrio alkaliphilus ACht1 TaxID=1313304 RepID=U7DAP9_9BACT|nr:hypothetical protein [Chitinivibrio alkaliphilus]ERP39107.1 hypothetical protein CALK_0273 [Chitinivibrio alkaliphilus ACht1]